MQLKNYTDFLNGAHAIGWRFNSTIGDYDIWETNFFFYIVNNSTGAIEKSATNISDAIIYAHQINKRTLQ